MADLRGILADLDAETAMLDQLVSGLSADGWRTPTPADGWTVAHQIAHLAWTDEVATLAARDATAFGDLLRRAVAAPDTIDREAAEGAVAEPAALLDRWRTQRADLAEALLRVPPGQKLPWFGPPMSAASMATARTMETWAHGQDVTDALGVAHESGPALRQVAYLGVRTRDFAYVLHDRTPPAEPFRIELEAPDGELWAWGPDDAGQRVTGPATDFCLLVTQRRHRDDLALVATGADAEAWLGIAQAFAGAPGSGRSPVSRA